MAHLGFLTNTRLRDETYIPNLEIPNGVVGVGISDLGKPRVSECDSVP